MRSGGNRPDGSPHCVPVTPRGRTDWRSEESPQRRSVCTSNLYIFSKVQNSGIPSSIIGAAATMPGRCCINRSWYSRISVVVRSRIWYARLMWNPKVSWSAARYRKTSSASRSRSVRILSFSFASAGTRCKPHGLCGANVFSLSKRKHIGKSACILNRAILSSMTRLHSVIGALMGMSDGQPYLLRSWSFGPPSMVAW